MTTHKTHPEEHDPSPYESRIFQIMQWLTEQRKHDKSIGFILLTLSRKDTIYDICNLLATLEANTLIKINESGKLFTDAAYSSDSDSVEDKPGFQRDTRS